MASSPREPWAGSVLLWGFTTLAHRLLAASLGTPLAEVFRPEHAVAIYSPRASS
jgi:hypothetical protein